MHGMIDFATLGLRDAYDLAIMIEEDALLRYEELAALLGADAGGAGDVCRAMAERERAHGRALVARRASAFRDAPPRLEISVLGEGVERPDADDDDLPRTGREALEVALAAERRAHAFFAASLRHLADPATRAFFRQLMDEEAEHVAELTARLAALPAAAGSARARRRRPAARSPWDGAAAYPDRALLAEALPRFDGATRAVAEGVLVAGRAPREVAEGLGVSSRTVRTKLARFVALARRHVAVATAAAALAGCAGNLARSASAPGTREGDPVAAQARRPLPDRSEAEQRRAGEERAQSDRAALAKQVHRHVAARMPAESAGLHRRLARAILAEAERARLDPFLVLALIHTESSFDPRAISDAGARGLMQLLEPTMRLERARAGLPPADPHDPVANVQAGVRYLRRLIDAFGDVDAALMAYNAGPSRIRGHLRRGAVPPRFQAYPQRVHGEVERLRVATDEPTPGDTLPARRGA